MASQHPHGFTLSHRPTQSESSASAAASASSSPPAATPSLQRGSSLAGLASMPLPAEYAEAGQLLRVRGDALSEPARFAHLPRIVLQLVVGFLSLKEMGVWCRTSRDIYATCAFFRSPLNTAAGGIRQRWLVFGREFSPARLRHLLRSPLRSHVTVFEATDPEAGLVTTREHIDLLAQLPYLTDAHCHYRWDRPIDWAEPLRRLVAQAGHSDAIRSLSPFKALMLCPHDAAIDGGAPLDEDEAETLWAMERAEREEEERKAKAKAGVDADAASTEAAASSSSSSSSSAPAASSPPPPASSSHFGPPSKAKQKFLEERKKKKPPPQTIEEEQKRKDEEEAHIAAWSAHNEVLLRETLPHFRGLEVLGLNLVGESTRWDVSAFRELSGLRTLELEVEPPWPHAFARQVSDIIEAIRDAPYTRLEKFQSNSLHAKHLVQLVRPNAAGEHVPAVRTLFQFKVYQDEPEDRVRAEFDAWSRDADEKWIRPWMESMAAAKHPDDETPVPDLTGRLTADQMLNLYAQMPMLRTSQKHGQQTKNQSASIAVASRFSHFLFLCVLLQSI